MRLEDACRHLGRRREVDQREERLRESRVLVLGREWREDLRASSLANASDSEQKEAHVEHGGD